MENKPKHASRKKRARNSLVDFLQTFRDVYKMGSYGRAAKNDQDRPNVRRRIQELAALLEVPTESLFEPMGEGTKVRGGLKPTPLAGAIDAKAAGILSAWRDILSAKNDQVYAEIRITGSSEAINYLIIRLKLQEFLAESANQGIRLTLDTTKQQESLNTVKLKNYDLAIFDTVPIDSNSPENNLGAFDRLPFAESGYVVVSHNEYDEPNCLRSELAKRNDLIAPGGEPWKLLSDMLSKDSNEKIVPRIMGGGWRAVMNCVRAKMGIGIVPALVFEQAGLTELRKSAIRAPAFNSSTICRYEIVRLRSDKPSTTAELTAKEEAIDRFWNFVAEKRPAHFRKERKH